jgi:hypothetical protein
MCHECLRIVVVKRILCGKANMGIVGMQLQEGKEAGMYAVQQKMMRRKVH